MITDSIVWGETYDLSVSAQDLNEDVVTIDDSWSAVCRFTSEANPNFTAFQSPMVISNNAASVAIDTGNPPWLPGVYFYDIRISDPDGNDFWSETVRLTLHNRLAPSS